MGGMRTGVLRFHVNFVRLFPRLLQDEIAHLPQLLCCCLVVHIATPFPWIRGFGRVQLTATARLPLIANIKVAGGSPVKQEHVLKLTRPHEDVVCILCM